MGALTLQLFIASTIASHFALVGVWCAVTVRIVLQEEEIDPAAGRACVAEPGKLLELDGEIVRKVREDYR